MLGGSTMLSVVTCSGSVGFSGSIGSVGVTGLNTLAVSVLNLSTVCCILLVGNRPNSDRSIGTNTDVGSCCVLALRVLVITGVAHLLKGDVTPGLGPVPVTRR